MANNEIRYLKFPNVSGSTITGQITDPDSINLIQQDNSAYTPATGVTISDNRTLIACSSNMRDADIGGDQYAYAAALKYVSFTATWTEAVHSTGNLTIGTIDKRYVPIATASLEQVFIGYRDNGAGSNRSTCRVIISSNGTIRVAPMCVNSDPTTWANYKRVMFHQLYI